MNKQRSKITSFARVCAGFLLIQFLLLISIERPAKAYVDPGSGALLWQGMLAAVVGSAFYVRRAVRSIKSKLHKGHGR